MKTHRITVFGLGTVGLLFISGFILFWVGIFADIDNLVPLGEIGMIGAGVALAATILWCLSMPLGRLIQAEINKFKEGQPERRRKAEEGRRKAEVRLIAERERLDMEATQEEEERRIQAKRPKNVCPKCGSKETAAIKKGYSAGAGAGGCLLLGPAGLLFGAVGSNKIEMYCLECGKKWSL